MTDDKVDVKYKLGILVVLYGCEYKDSATLLSLKELKLGSDVKLVIWNNGPTHITVDASIDYFPGVEIRSSIENLPLSYIYNCFLQAFSCDKYVFFDHDSEVSASYISSLIMGPSDLFLPRIVIGDKGFFPICRQTLSPIVSDMKTDSYSVSSIMTGICISEQLKAQYIDVYGSVFDERFALYGIDTTFFIRMLMLPKMDVCVTAEVLHSLSSQDPIESKSEFRLKERAFDTAIHLRHYPSKTVFKAYCLGVMKSLMTGDLTLTKTFIKGFLTGVHPRSRTLIERKNA